MDIVNTSQIKNLMGLRRHQGKAEVGENGAEREGGLVFSDGRKGLWEDQAIPLHSGEGNQMLREWELEMQLLSPHAAAAALGWVAAKSLEEIWRDLCARQGRGS